MKWIRIDKRNAGNDRPGTYRTWKPELAEEGQHQCVYCAIRDNDFGGEYHFHVEHFEPKSKARHRVNDWTNLFYSCAICNVFKGDDWPTPGTEYAYIDPSAVDYGTILIVASDGTVSGTTTNGRYMVERLYLNRPQLIVARRQAMLVARLRELQAWTDSIVEAIASPLMDDAEARKALIEIHRAERKVQELRDSLDDSLLYASNEVRRPKGHGDAGA